MEEPRDALAAPSHTDPYAWYARLRVRSPLAYDAQLKLWVVAGPYLVEQALQHLQLRVRPPAEPVPKALLGRPTGDVFAQLVRMNDGDFHARHRPAVEAAAARFAPAAVAQATEAATRDLAPRLEANALLSAIPVQAMARLLGVAGASLDRTVEWVHEFTRGIGPGVDADTLERSDTAARALLAQGERDGLQPFAAANRIAFMQQSLDATAGLIGNAVCAALRQGEEAPDAGELVAHVARHDPAVHNTRRFAAADVELGGERIAAGDALLLLLVNEHPFGGGAHACPGDRIALQIAVSALRTLQVLEPLQDKFRAVRGYRPLPNARIPVFS
ncbi:hypothetical protein HHL11_16115 [Ramlibacter sp. G-1-2-2]|uniref:Cytochrome P450 n=1 Tax=Ramlibacter agri TaxID=2728837 RepID=A0A848H6Z2_9BURK|nr:hypothetical protein [Ramlibacter agri]NML45279.1 hypothetical protein [Ramlibacter agri]